MIKKETTEQEGPQRVTPDELAGKISPFYSCGSETDRPVINELYPALPKFPDEGSRKVFKRSRCYWGLPGEVFNISWEVVGQARVEDVECNINEVGLCEARHPVTQVKLKCEDQDVGAVISTSTQTGIVTLLRQCGPANQADSENPLNECRAFGENCRELSPSDSCENQHARGTWRFCLKHCALPPLERSGTYQAVVTQDRVNALAIKNFTPTINVVRNHAKLGRVLANAAPPEPTPNVRRYTWTVKRSDGRPFDDTPADDQPWEENFSPEVSISQVRVFQKSVGITGFEKRFLKIKKLSIYQIGPTLLASSSVADCDPQDGISVTPGTCPQLSASNPAYTGRSAFQPMAATRAEQARPIRWEVDVDNVDHSIDFSREILIEFTIIADQPAGPVVAAFEPSSINLGQFAGNFRTDTLLKFRNLGSEVATIQEITVSGANPDAFSVELLPGKSLPQTLYSGMELPLVVKATARPPYNLLTAEAQFEVANRRGEVQTFRLPLSADALIPQFEVQPETLSFLINPSVRRETREKNLYITNVGRTPFTVDRIEIVGGSAAHFRIVSPPTRRFTIEVGGLAQVRVRFDPPTCIPVSGRRRPVCDFEMNATLRARTVVREITVPLVGVVSSQ